MNIHYDFPSGIVPDRYVGIDLEMFGMEKSRLHRPHGQFACLSIAISTDDVVVIQQQERIQVALHKIQDCIWVFHNAKFDITQLRMFVNIPPRKKLWDTMLIERILFGGYYTDFALKDLARRYLDVKMDKTAQEQFGKVTVLSKELLEYSAYDPIVTLQICHEQRKIMTSDDWRIWNEVDRDALWAVMDFQGMAIDSDKWLALSELNTQRADSIAHEFSINLNSPKQLVSHLTSKGFKGLKSSAEAELVKMSKKYPKSIAAEHAAKVLDYRMYKKRTSTYGATFLLDHAEDEHGVKVVHPDWNITGATTGRMSCNSPSLQNIPARETKEFRECFIARPGHKLIIADYGAQEPRITAHISQDKRLIEIFHTENADVYCEMAWDIYAEKIDKKNPMRSDMKPVFLGATYGLTEYGLSKRLGISVEDARELLKKFFQKYKGVANYVRQQQRKKSFVTTVLGRKFWLNPYTSQSERNSLNSPIQGSAGDMIKQAFVKMHKEWEFDFSYAVVGVIHDEIVLDVPEERAKEVSVFVRQCMVEVGETMCPSVPFTVDVSIGNTWAEKK